MMTLLFSSSVDFSIRTERMMLANGLSQHQDRQTSLTSMHIVIHSLPLGIMYQ
jgi:hypothetical protein